ncbi:MAG: tetratricopeptide repeat protein [Planctomycetes bacterium]|nr:tetratricopeptide repeat protein [Planctomycetota bacterium]
MTRTRFLFATLLGLTLASDASAQFFAPIIGLPVIARDGIAFHIGGRRLRIDGFLGFGPPYPAVVPVTPTPFGFRQVAPAYLPYSYYGYGYGYSYGFPFPGYGSINQNYSLTIITPPALVRPRLSLVQDREVEDLSGIDLDVESPTKIWGNKRGLAKGRPGANKDELVKAPKGEDEKKNELAANQVKPPAALPPKVDRRSEGEQLIDEGIASFRKREFGLALLRFRQAGEADPPGPRAGFYQAQANLAIGKYAQAADLLKDALRKNPDWPASNFRPKKDLYGDPADLMNLRKRLEQAQAADPNDADLLFLLGYLSWFDGQRDEAVALFNRSRVRAGDTQWCDLFLKVAKK